MIRTAIFGGSFNPIHNGHLRLARKIVEQGWVDELWLMVSPQNPLKQQQGLLDEQIRFRLAQLATQEVPGVEACDFEFHLERPSYTWKTLAALKEAYPDREFSLVIGGDNWEIFPRWAHYEEILAQYPLIIYPREGYAVHEEDLPATAHLINAPLFPWSSTQIREALRSGHDVGEMLPASIIPIIQENKYYMQ